ncbi:MAG TPA: helix-turn-helix transcriptional regulator [Kribbella sp.]|nr:helix-turn-helix transcriptional regulator [Kribbella sp.]
MRTPRLDPDRVIKARYNQGLTATELAKRSGLSKQLISQIEHGRRAGSVETQKAIADALGVLPADLWSDLEQEVAS